MSILTTARQPDKSDLLASFTNGVIPDSLLYKQEIAVQKAWASGLTELGLLTKAESIAIDSALNQAAILMEAGKFDWRTEDEDIHMNIERFVNENAHGLGKKMHIGRSRNDLIATTLRLHVADSANHIVALLDGLIQSLVGLAGRHIDVIIPGMTHLQNGQPIRWSHAILGHAWGVKRTKEKFAQVKTDALESMPLGSAALGGTTIPINLEKISQQLGFKNPTSNSYDAVGDRDSVLAFLQACAFYGTHLSRLAEDIIYWASAPVGLIKLSPAWSTGSSIMPNKRNPDVAELARGKSALWMGDLCGTMTLVKGLGTSYGSDLHESKLPYLRVCQDVQLTTKVFTHFSEELSVNSTKAKELLNHGHILATEIADHLTMKGLAFREAYGVVASLVEIAEAKGVQVHELPATEIQNLNQYLDKSFLENLTFENAVEKRNFSGGTSKSQVMLQIKMLS